MNQAYLLIGGNLGNREQNIERAQKEIAFRCGRILQCSSLYETAAWGKTDQPDFLNLVLKIQTALGSMELLEQVLAAEQAMGRHRLEKYGPRIIDLDILFFNEEIIETRQLQVPHPRMYARRFVLVPLAEIAAEKIHPVTGKTVAEMLESCPDSLAVNKFIPIVDKKG